MQAGEIDFGVRRDTTAVPPDCDSCGTPVTETLRHFINNKPVHTVCMSGRILRKNEKHEDRHGL